MLTSRKCHHLVRDFEMAFGVQEATGVETFRLIPQFAVIIRRVDIRQDNASLGNEITSDVCVV